MKTMVTNMERKDVEELAEYNSRVSRGVLHTPEYVEKMRRLQEQYNEEMGLI